MRNLLIIALLLGGAFMAGWFKVNRDGDRTTIEINKTEIRQDTRQAIDRGREILRQHELQNRSADSSLQQTVSSWNQQLQGNSWNQNSVPLAFPNESSQQAYGPLQYPGQPPQSSPPSTNWPSTSWQYPPSPQGNPSPQNYSR